MLKKYLMNKMFLRNVGLIFGEIDNYSSEPGHFTPYFQYEVGPYKDGFIMYFPKLPNATLYYNSIFLKLWAYNPQDAIKYIEAHYTYYPDKKDFLLFLKRQLQHRISGFKKGSNSSRVSIANISLDWVDEELAELKDKQKIQVYNQFVRQDLTVIVKNELQNTVSSSSNPVSVDQLTNQICDDLQRKLDSILDNTESRIIELTDKYETGNIQLNNLNLKDKLILLFICLKDLTSKASRKNKSGEPLFAKMDLNDIALILRLHFAHYKGSKVDSIERPIYRVNNNLKSDDPIYLELNKALQKFFFNN
jgi:hypothetical protein